MYKRLFSRALALWAMLVLTQVGLRAQSPAPNAVTYQVNGLTAAHRDAISQDLAARGDLRIAYACVPAGILVLEPNGTTMRGSLRPNAEAVLDQQFGRQAYALLPIDRQQAEAQCATVRNQ